MRKGMVLLVHGSRQPEWLEPFEELRAVVERLAAGTPIRLACLQFSRPTLAEAVTELAEAGVRKVVVVPVFFSVRGHVLKDVPRLMAEVQPRFAGLTLSVAPAVGEEPEVAAALRQCLVRRAQELAGGDNSPAGEGA